MFTIRTYRILKFLDEGILVEQMHDKQQMTLVKIYIPKNAKVGDILQRTEHNFYDVIDEDGNYLSQWS